MSSGAKNYDMVTTVMAMDSSCSCCETLSRSILLRVRAAYCEWSPSITATIHEQLRMNTEQAEVAGQPQHHDVEDIVMVAITSARPRWILGIAAAQQCFMYLSLVDFRTV